MIIKEINTENRKPTSQFDYDEGKRISHVDWLDNPINHTPFGHRSIQWVIILVSCPILAILWYLAITSGLLFLYIFTGVMSLWAAGSYIQHKEKADKFYKPKPEIVNASIPNPTINSDARTSICPFCAEIIKRDAIVCKHCQRDIPSTAL